MTCLYKGSVDKEGVPRDAKRNWLRNPRGPKPRERQATERNRQRCNAMKEKYVEEVTELLSAAAALDK